MRIDSHLHLWDPARGDYGWLTPQLAPLYRRFAHSDARPLLDAAAIDGVILVQAAPTAEESDYLLSIAQHVPWVMGVVGWLDFDAEDAAEDVARRARHPKWVGVRPMLQDLEDPQWILAPHRAAALMALQQHRLVFDALIRPVHLQPIAQLAAAYPTLTIVIDHAAKPGIREPMDRLWMASMERVARFGNVHCKLSGLLTELQPGAARDAIAPHVQLLLELFAPDRLIWGSDWPVLTLAGSYGEWHELSRTYLARLGEAGQRAVMGGNARQTYRLGRLQ